MQYLSSFFVRFVWNNFKQYSLIVTACNIMFEDNLGIHFSYCETRIVFSFCSEAYFSSFGYYSNKIWNQANFLCKVLRACKILNKSNKRLLRYCTFNFSLPCQIVSVISNLWKWGWKPRKWWRLSCLNFLLWDAIPRGPFDTVRSVMAHFF